MADSRTDVRSSMYLPQLQSRLSCIVVLFARIVVSRVYLMLIGSMAWVTILA